MKIRLILIFIFCSLTACSPRFDWRSSRHANHGDTYHLTFPGKALVAQKTVLLNRESHVLTLNGVQVDSAQFVLGSVPAQNAAQAQALAQALATAFETNLASKGGQTPLILNKTLGAFDALYPSTGRYAQARFMWTATAAYELLVVGKASDIPPETADTFIRSMKFE
jgi:hypothetical protein